MILYHAGPQWVHVFEALVNRAVLAKALHEQHGFTQCMLYEPFGAGRGAVIAKRGHMVVMALGAENGTEWYAVAPSKELQDLIWSFSKGFAGQWSALELKVITGYDDWKSLLAMAGHQFSEVVGVVQRTIDGPTHADPAEPALDPFYGNALEVPADYLYSLSGEEIAECVH